jgi:hypothetical protein
MFGFVGTGKTQILSWCFPGLFDEAVQQHHSLICIDVENYPRDSICCQICTDLKQTAAQRPCNRHSHWPAKFNSFDIFSDALLVILTKRPKPVA